MARKVSRNSATATNWADPAVNPSSISIRIFLFSSIRLASRTTSMLTKPLHHWLWRGLTAPVFCLAVALGQEVPKSDPAAQQLVAENIGHVLSVLAPDGGQGLPIAVTLKCLSASSGLKFLEGQDLHFSYQAPDKLRLEVKIEGILATLGRNGHNLWIRVPDKNFALRGADDVPRFATRPDSTGRATMDFFKLPVKKEQLALLPALTVINKVTDSSGLDVVTLQLKAEAAKALKAPGGQIGVRLGASDGGPDRISYQDGDAKVEFEIVEFRSGADVPEDEFELKTAPSDHVGTVANSHLSKFLSVLVSSLGSSAPPLPPAKGVRKVLGTSGAGRLESWDGAKVVYLKGTPEEMGRQHGELLKSEIRSVVDRILYGVGVGSSFEKGRWFFGEIEECQKRQKPFVDERYLREMDALAATAGLEKEEVRLANFFPELFHCSGFALTGKSTADGKIYHGRVLDYLKGVGLEENAVVQIIQPDQGHAWVNVSYAGFIGSVTGMNEKQVAIGEMGGRGEGNWDGKPMAQLMREIMEKADTVEEALDIMKKGPRTCEYYYVISDAKSHKACGVKATPGGIEVIWQGDSHPQLSDPVADTVLMSAGDRYTTLVQRVKDGFGKFTAESARDLMMRPVCMNSNIHSVLFCPDTLDFWVANADGKNVASHTRYTKYNLREMLTPAAK